MKRLNYCSKSHGYAKFGISIESLNDSGKHSTIFPDTLSGLPDGAISHQNSNIFDTFSLK